MSIALVFAIVAAALFGLAFITNRRFGVLGLGLAAGSMLSELWAAKLTPLVADAGVNIDQPPLVTLVAIALVLLPATLLLLNGPKYDRQSLRIVGASLFAALSLALLVEPLGSALVLQGSGRAVYEFVSSNRVYIVTICLMIAVADLFFTNSRHEKAKH